MFTWLSGFLVNPAMAIGAAAVASPILIHLLSRRRFRRIRWAAMDFLLEAQRQSRRRVRLEQMILLALRCLAVLLLALLVARPFMRSGPISSLIGGAARTERILLLDDSFSMGYRLGAHERVFSRGLAAARRIAAVISAEARGDSWTLLTTSRPLEPVLALSSLSEENMHRLNLALESLRPSETTARFTDAFKAVADLIRRPSGKAHAALYVISDFQRSDWVASDEDGGAGASPAEMLARMQPGLSLTLVDVGADSPRNVAIVELAAQQPQIAAGVSASFRVGVANYSPEALSPVELSLRVGEHVLPPLVIPRIQPGQVVHEPLEVRFPRDGSDFLLVQLAGAAASEDPLTLDNTRAAAVDIVPAVQVLLVDGEPNNDAYRDEIYLLKTALRPAGRAASGNEVTIVEEHELDGVEGDRYHVIVLANVARLSPAAEKQLHEYVRRGGGLLVFLGDQVDADHYNRQLYREGAGVLPASIGPQVDAPGASAPITFGSWDAAHPVFRAFVNELGAVLRQVRIESFMTLAETGGAAILARFSDAASSPALVARRFGEGTCVLVATTADQEWNDWAANFSFVPLMLELVQYAARPAEVVAPAVVNEPIRCAIDLATFKPAATLRPPTYPMEPEIPLSAQVAPGSVPALVHPSANRAGVWRFELMRLTGEPQPRFAAVNPDPAESNPARASRTDLESSLADVKFEYVRDPEQLSGKSIAARQELWWPVLVAVLAVLMTEQTMAWWFGTRG